MLRIEDLERPVRFLISPQESPDLRIPRIIARSGVFQLSPVLCLRKGDGDEERIEVSIFDAMIKFV